MNETILNLLNYFLMGIIGSFSNIFVWSKIIDKKLNFKNYRFWLISFIVAVILLLNYFFVNQYIRMLIITIVFCISAKLLFKINLKSSIILAIYSQILSIISEMIYAFIILSFNNLTTNEIVLDQFGTLFTNLMISLILVFISLLKFNKKIYLYLLKATDKINLYHLAFFLSSLMLFTNVILAMLYYNENIRYLISITTLLTTSSFVIIFYSFKTKNSYIKVYDKYNTTLNSLKEYEDILDKYRIETHENRNQLLTIRNMIPKNSKKLISYVDEILSNKLKDDDKIIKETYLIPTGGLRGLIYSKLLLMKEKQINYNLNFSNDIRTVDLINKIDDSTMLDICQIIGVYIDNAIDAVLLLDNRLINIDMYIELDNLVISITNNYKGIIDLDKIEHKGYTTKSNGHGYGLALAKEIIDKNKRLNNEKKVSKENFSQILKIKM